MEYRMNNRNWWTACLLVTLFRLCFTGSYNTDKGEKLATDCTDEHG